MKRPSPFKKPTSLHVFINLYRKNPLNKGESNDLADLVQEFLEKKIHKKTGHAGSGHVWVRMPQQ